MHVNQSNEEFIISSIYPFDFPAKFIDEPSARSKTTIVFASDTPSGIFRALELSPRAKADKSTDSISFTANVKVFLSIN
jgi:hypothetical protein